jgi:hypothetical protein
MHRSHKTLKCQARGMEKAQNKLIKVEVKKNAYLQQSKEK